MQEMNITEKKPMLWKDFPVPVAGTIKLTTEDKGKILAAVSPPSGPPGAPAPHGPGGIINY